MSSIGQVAMIWAKTHSLLLQMLLSTKGGWQKMISAITLLVLRTAKFGDPGGVWCSNSEVKAVFAICIHSSRVFRKVSQVDFNRAPISISLCGKKSIGRNELTTEDKFGATNVCKAHSFYSCAFWLTWIKIQCVSCSENWHHILVSPCSVTTLVSLLVQEP